MKLIYKLAFEYAKTLDDEKIEDFSRSQECSMDGFVAGFKAAKTIAISQVAYTHHSCILTDSDRIRGFLDACDLLKERIGIIGEQETKILSKK